MRILVLAPHPFFQHRGTPIAVRLLCEVLGGAGHHVDLLTFHEGQDVEMPGVRIFRIDDMPRVLHIRPGFSWKKLVCDYHLRRLAEVRLAVGSYDVIHAVEESAFFARKLGRRFGVPYVYDMDSSLASQMEEKFGWLRPVGPYMRSLEAKLVAGSSGVVAVCKALEDLARAHGPDTPILRLEDISLLGLDSLKDPSPVKPIEAHGRVIMYVGNLEAYQGIDLLIDAFATAAPHIPDARLVLVGGPAGMEKYQAKAESLGLADRVVLAGPRPPGQLDQVLAMAEVVVSPRIKGGNTPMKIYSYLDSGRPLLATNLYTHTQVLDDEISLLVKPRELDMARGMIRLLNNPDMGREIAARAKKRVAEQFSLPAFSQKLLGFYAELEQRLGGADAGGGR